MNAISLDVRGPPSGAVAIEAGAVDFHLSTERLEDKPRNSIKVPLPIAISDAFVAEILKPYRPNAKYLKSAEITRVSDEALYDSTSKESLITAVGRFSIPESCYIDDTGHFNAVEFNICFNQLAYVMFGKSVEAGVLQKIWPISANYLSSFTEYKKHQLPAMLIVRVDGVRFFKPMKSGDFRAELTIDRMTMLGEAGFVYTTITFSDCDGVKAKGCVVLAFQPNLTLEG
jgi:hypothetical protein